MQLRMPRIGIDKGTCARESKCGIVRYESIERSVIEQSHQLSCTPFTILQYLELPLLLLPGNQLVAHHVPLELKPLGLVGAAQLELFQVEQTLLHIPQSQLQLLSIRLTIRNLNTHQRVSDYLKLLLHQTLTTHLISVEEDGIPTSHPEVDDGRMLSIEGELLPIDQSVHPLGQTGVTLREEYKGGQRVPDGTCICGRGFKHTAVATRRQ